jgi:2-polyprenyl-6-methoxyphenol hydroxylase-like FAD-dependent oxidoreductase
MASAVVMMVAGAVLNATAFTGSMYLAKSLDKQHEDQERIRHDKALEAYQKQMGDYEKKRQAYQDWLTKEYTDKKQADENLNSTDQALSLYRKTHPDIDFNKPQFSDFYKPSSKQKQYEMMYVGGGMLGVGYVASKFL